MMVGVSLSLNSKYLHCYSNIIDNTRKTATNDRAKLLVSISTGTDVLRSNDFPGTGSSR